MFLVHLVLNEVFLIVYCNTPKPLKRPKVANLMSFSSSGKPFQYTN